MIKQNIVFVENKAGSLKRVTGLLANNNINIYGFACFDAPEFAIFRMICDGLDELLKIMADSNVSLDYIYTSFHRKDLRPVVILHSEDITVTESVLKNNGFKVFSAADELEK